MPDQSQGWALVDYRTEQRDSSSDEGRFSHIWCYRSQGELAQVSTDFPFLGWHELTRCYQARGWTVQDRRVWPGEQGETGAVVEVQLSKPTGERGLLFFSLFDSRGRSLDPQVTHWRGIRGKLATSPLMGLLGNPVSASATTLQVQQFSTGVQPFSDAERRELRGLYGQLRARLHRRWQQYTEADRHG